MKRILVVDDSIGNRELLEDILSERYAVDTAADGQETIEKLKANNDYSMILLDLMMPVVDGFGVLEYMRDHDLQKKYPVIIISGDSDVKTESRCFDYGVSDFIAKPFKEKIILKRVENILSLKEAIRKAEYANASKTAFLFNLSHDIRTPMNAIVGYSNLLEKDMSDEETARNYLSKIKTSSGFLLSLINSVLEMSRIESGHVTLEETLVKSDSVAKSLFDVFSERMSQKGIRYNFSSSYLSEYLYMDKVKANEIFLNLLSNAYKYTEKGGTVTFTVEEKPCEEAGFSYVETTVSDTGIGMSKEFLPHLFEDFSREESETVSKIEGTGLGMPIVKKLVDLMGGTIHVESELGKGTTFVVTLKHRIGESPTESEEPTATYDYSLLSGKRILLAEDNDINAEIATINLECSGFVVERAANGCQCVDMLGQAEANYYDVILMDVQMPKMDGYEATKAIRSLEDKDKAGIPILAVTANAFEEDRKNALAAGMDGHIGKPIEISVLLDTLARILL